MNDNFDSVRTSSGSRLHYARNNGNVTLCGRAVVYRREGLQWDDPKIRALRTCQVCTNKAGAGPS